MNARSTLAGMSAVGIVGFLLLFLSLLLSLGVAGCSSTDRNETSIWVFGASSLSDVLRELGESFSNNEPENKKVKINFQFGGSSQLVQQINEGAPVDLLAVANEKVLDNLRESPSAARTFAQSRLVIAVPQENPKNITGLEDLENSNLLLGVCGRDVPCGSLAVSVFERAGAPLNPDTYETSARAVLNKLLLGELDVGLIYEVDVIAANRESERLLAIPVPNEAARNNYVAVLVGDGSNENSNSNEAQAAAKFLEYLSSPKAREILAAHGFLPPISSSL